jgi:prevent-host-death family protein
MEDARDGFSAMIEAARRRPQTVTEHGKPVVVVVAAEEFERLRQLERLRATTFVEHLLSMPKDDCEFERLAARPR